MEKLIDQITALSRQRDNIPDSDARFMALKEIVFAGLARGSFFRSFPYLPEMDSLTKDCLYLTCLHQSGCGSFEPDAYFSFLKNELYARGDDFTAAACPDGFDVIYDMKDRQVRLRIFVYPGDVSADRIRIVCGEGPLFYENRLVDKAMDEERKGIRKALQKLMKSSEKKERTAKKQEAVTIENYENQWIQPSLFDL